MQLTWAVLCALCLLGCCAPVQGLFGSSSLQDYVDGLVDAAKFKLEGMLSINDSTVNRMWSYFKSTYGRAYSSMDEEKSRLRTFRTHLKYILESKLNTLRTFDLELNEFADWTLDEFNSLKKGLITSTNLRRYLSNDDSYDPDSVRRSLNKLYGHHYHQRRWKRSMRYRRRHRFSHDRRGFTDWIWSIFNPDNGNNNNNNNNNNNGQSTSAFDWRSQNVVGSVKNQLNCGCCYAFATASVLETLYAIKTKSSTVVEFSPQQITDCSSNGNNGCGGGNFPPSIRYLATQGGKIATHASYPYVGKKQTCKTTGINQINLGTLQYGEVPQGDEKAMAKALVDYGPIFIGLDADSQLFMFYKTGVLSITGCPTRRQDMDHAMVVVGYGYDNALKLPYWIIKNSWAEKWGEKGYFRLVKDKGNMCGIASMAYYAKLT